MVTIFGMRGAETRSWSRPKALRWVREANSTRDLRVRTLRSDCAGTTIRITGGDAFGCEIDFPTPQACARWLARYAPEVSA